MDMDWFNRSVHRRQDKAGNRGSIARAQAQQPVLLRDRFELNGDVSGTDSVANTTPDGIGARLPCRGAGYWLFIRPYARIRPIRPSNQAHERASSDFGPDWVPFGKCLRLC